MQSIDTIGLAGAPACQKCEKSAEAIENKGVRWWRIGAAKAEFFVRVTNFVSRKQECRSDELACWLGGKQAAIRALEKIHGAELFWPVYWITEVVPVIELSYIPDIGEGFRQFLSATAGLIRASIAEELKPGKTNPLDTHPSLADRIAAMEQLEAEDFESSELPASSLLNQPQFVELQFVEANQQIPRDSLKYVTWNDVGTVVTIPFWRSEIGKFGSVFLGKKVVSIPELVKDLPEIGSRLPDPKGRLLTPMQRTDRAARLLGMALSLKLLEKGWALDKQPAVRTFRRGSETVDGFELVSDLAEGRLSVEDWVQKCAEVGIAEETLAEVTSQIVPSPSV